jgi:hypothetical protein
MKIIKILLAYLALAGAATLAFGGPGPQLWSTQEKIQNASKARPAAPAKDAAQVAGCGTACSCAAMKKS